MTLSNGAGAAGAQVGVEVLGQDKSRAAGVNGVIVALKPQATDGAATALRSAATPKKINVGLDYGFLKSAQAQLGQRLRWVSLPACVLTTPEKPSCQVQTALPSKNDATSHTVTAAVSVAGNSSPIGQSSSSTPAAPPATPTGSTVLAAVAGSSGSNGDFTATPLKPSGSWSAGDGTGSFTWSYPLVLPDAGFGDDVAPEISLGYDSRFVDGQIAGQNDQSSWIGEGWGYTPGSIQRTYRTCSDDTSLPSASKTSDLCWAGQVLTMSLDGRSNAIVRDDTTGTYRLQDDDGSKVQHLTGASNGAHDGEYWVVTDTGGTKYYFGRNALPGGTATNSVNTVPVYGAKSGDPCYNAAGFSSSRCDQAWAWNLDMVEDTHHNVTTYSYAQETNYYGANKGTTPIKYTRASYPTKIEYGLIDTGSSVYGTAAAAQVVFNSSERCISSSTFTCSASAFTKTNAAHWPDTPQDQACSSTGTCNVHAPTFWTQKRLTSIDTQYRSGTSYATADTYTLTQSFANTGDAQMSLDQIVRTGKAGGSTSLPAVVFGYDEYNNRIDGLNDQPQMMRKRMTYVGTETGEGVSVSYNTDPGQSGRAPAQCTASTLPTDLASNTSECFPVRWTPYGFSKPITDYFHTYVVTQVTTNSTSESMPNRTTTYTYTGGAAWHYDNDETIKPSNRTYGQWRGYAGVDTRTGDSSGWTLTRDTYYRGMDGNKQGTGTQSVKVADSTGAQHVDSEQFAGAVLEEQVFNGSARVSSNITVPEIVKTTASRARDGLPALTATVTADKETRAITDRASGGDLSLVHDFTYNDLGQVTSDSETGTSVPSLCTTTKYATGTNGISAPSEIITSGQACPGGTTPQSSVLSVDRNFYDGSGTLGVVPGPGDVTRKDSATSSASTFAKATATYDAAGREISSTKFASSSDAKGRTTKTVYTPETGGPVTGVAVTNPLGQTTSQTTNPAHGTVTKAVDAAGHVTTATYDALGRITAVWRPGQTQGTTPATTAFAYLVSKTAPSAITTTTLVDPGTGKTSTLKSVQIFDSYGEVQQTQADAAGGGSMVSDTGFDAHGWTTSANNHYYIGEAPSTKVFVPTDDLGNINNRTTTSYDLAGRATATNLYNGTTLTSTTKLINGGDRVTTLPPSGGVATTSITDVRGHTIETDRWSSLPTISGSTYTGGTAVRTTYDFDAAGRQTSMATAVGTPKEQSWTTTYDLAGNVVKQKDPESGSSTATFDDLGEQLTSTDARGNTVATTYDLLGRKTGEYAGSASGTRLTGFVYDSLQKGKLTSSTRYADGVAYTTAATGYDSAGRPTGSKVSLTKPGFASSYTSSSTYTSTGLLKSTTLPAAGSSAEEKLTYTYDGQGNASTLKGASTYVAGMQYDRDGLPVRFQLNGSPTGYVLDDLDGQTRAVRDRSMAIGFAVQDDVHNTFDKAGNLTKSVNTQGAPGAAPVSTTCYRYDGLDQLTQAWTATDACASDPSSNAGAKVGGPQSFWESWTFDAAGNRTSQVAHQLPASATVAAAGNVLTPKVGSNTTTYTYGDPVHPNLMTAASTTGPNPVSRSQAADAAGDVTSRHTPTGDQTITYDDQGSTASITTAAGTTRYVNDTDGNPLVKTGASGAVTLYLGGEDITVTGSGSSATVSKVVRYYSVAGRQVAYRINAAGPVFEVPNTQGTVVVRWDPASAAGHQIWRSFADPYGNNLGVNGDGPALAAGMASGRGFLNQPTSGDTGVVDTGLRKYDPTTGVFLSVDPLLDAGNPVQWNGYAYGGGNPVGNADPSGAMFPPGAGPVVVPRGGGGHHGGGHRPAPARKPPPSYPPAAWWGQGGSAYQAPHHDPRVWWGAVSVPARGKYADPRSYAPTASATKPSGGAMVVGHCGGWAQANGMCRDQQLAVRDGIRANYTKTEFFLLALSYPLMPLEGAGEAFSAYRAARVVTTAEKAATITDVPLIKAGSAGGESAGKVFPRAVKDAAREENPSTCVYCRMETGRPQIDHAIPRARGGNATLDNAQTTCAWCNASKGARDFPVNPPPGFRGAWPPAWWGLP